MKEVKDKFLKGDKPRGKGLKFVLLTVGGKVQVWLERHLSFAKAVNAIIHEIFDEQGNTINNDDDASTKDDNEVPGTSRVRKTRNRSRRNKGE